MIAVPEGESVAEIEKRSSSCFQMRQWMVRVINSRVPNLLMPPKALRSNDQIVEVMAILLDQTLHWCPPFVTHGIHGTLL